MDLSEFLAARLNEDEMWARAAEEDWDAEHVRYEFEDLPDAVFAHVRRHDPARVLRDVEAKRAILAEHIAFRDAFRSACEDPVLGHRPGPGVHAAADALRRTVKALTFAYNDHPDYKVAWAS